MRAETSEQSARRGFINFGQEAHGGDSPWVGFSTRGAQGVAFDHRNPAWLRVFMFALMHLEKSGHAPFQAGLLSRLIATDSDGVLVIDNQRSREKRLDDAIRGARERGLLTAQSCRRCLVPNPWIAQQGKGGRQECSYHLSD